MHNAHNNFPEYKKRIFLNFHPLIYACAHDKMYIIHMHEIIILLCTWASDDKKMGSVCDYYIKWMRGGMEHPLLLKCEIGALLMF